MPWYERVLTSIYYLILILCLSFIGWGVFDTGKNVYDDFNNQEAQLRELYDNQALLLNKFYRSNARPSYDYLASVSVYIVTDTHGGSGTVIKKKGNTSYILTNKHVCNKKHINKCSIVTEFGVIKLEFVKESYTDDIALWKTNRMSGFFTEVKGFREIYQGDKVYSVGHYLGLPYIYTEGTFAGYTLELDPLFNLPCVFGCSGSGIFDNEGYFIGIISAVPVFIIPSSKLPQVDTNKALGVKYENIMLFLDEIIN